MHPNVHSSTIYNSQVLEATEVPISKWVYQKTVVHLHNEILHNRKKGAPTLCNDLDGTGEHYGKWNKPRSEEEIPYDLTYKWKVINKTNKQAKYNNRHWNKEQSDSNQRGGGRGIIGDNGSGIKEHIWRTHGQSQRGWVWGRDVGMGGEVGCGGVKM